MHGCLEVDRRIRFPTSCWTKGKEKPKRCSVQEAALERQGEMSEMNYQDQSLPETRGGDCFRWMIMGAFDNLPRGGKFVNTALAEAREGLYTWDTLHNLEINMVFFR